MNSLGKCHITTVMVALLLISLGLAGCATAKAGPRPDGLEPGGTVIFQDRIEEMRVRTALEAVERAATHLLIQREKQGSPVKITHRGRDSLTLSGVVQVVIDGALVNDGVQALENIPANSVEFIQILSGRESVLRYGSTGGNGVIIVKTTAG
jgi:outer membrane cobalamin receptor